MMRPSCTVRTRWGYRLRNSFCAPARWQLRGTDLSLAADGIGDDCFAFGIRRLSGFRRSDLSAHSGEHFISSRKRVQVLIGEHEQTLPSLAAGIAIHVDARFGDEAFAKQSLCLRRNDGVGVIPERRRIGEIVGEDEIDHAGSVRWAIAGFE